MRKLVLLASACLVGGTVDAQATVNGRPATAEQERRALEAVTAVREGVMQRMMLTDSAAMNRATLGISLGGAAHKRDTLGVFVEAVAEDGPAERAGIYEGHRIAFINNVDVRASAADAGDSYLSGVGRHRLMRAMRDVSAGSPVSLRVWTGSGYRDVQVTAARFADVYKNQRIGMFFEGSHPGAMTFAPALEAMKMSAPDVRYLELQPTEGTRRRIRATPAPRTQRKTTTTVTPSLRGQLVPSVRVAPGAARTPRLAPTPSVRRRYTI